MIDLLEKTVEIKDPETGEPTFAWACGCGCPPQPGNMCVLRLEEDEKHVKSGDLLYAHLNCIAPMLEPLHD